MLPISDNVPSRHPSFVTWSIIAVNVLVFVYQSSLGEFELFRLVYLYGIVPRRFANLSDLPMGLLTDAGLPLITNMFLHGGLLHLISNMWPLYLFGDNVEDRIGHINFLLFYLLTGVIAGGTHIVFNLSSTVPAVGASGAIAGIMAAYFVFFPTARIVTLVPVFFIPMFFHIPAFFFVLIWFMTQLYSGVVHTIAGGSEMGGIAWWAHIGGFVAGIGLQRLFGGKGKGRDWYDDEYRPW